MLFHSLTRRSALKHLLLTLSFQQVAVRAQDVPPRLAHARSMRTASQEARRRGQPLVVMVTLRGCAWCDFVRNSHLLPLMREQGIHAVEIDLGGDQVPLQDFDDRSTTHKAFALKLAIQRAPTLLFFDTAGIEVAPRLVGVSSQDFYGAYLEQRLDTARKLIHPH